MDYRVSDHLIPIFDFGVLHLELNTALFILVLVLVVMFAMNRLLFQPVLRTLDSRSALTADTGEETRKRLAEIESLDADYRARLADVREEVNRLRQEARRETEQEVASILADARREADAELKSALAALATDTDRLRGELLAGVDDLARKIGDRVLEG